MINKVALYLRKSRDEENESKDVTLARHENLLRDYCKRNKLHIVEVYKEVVSGESIANRPEMQRLLDDVDAGLYTGVVCVEIERLSRGNQLDQVEILEVFKNSNTKIYTLQKIYDLSKEEIDEEFFEFSLFMSRREYKIIRRRMERGRAQAMKEGYYTGSITPYGYTKVKDGRGSYVYRCITHGCKNRRIVCPAIETALLEKLKTELKDFNYLLDNYEDELKSKRQKRDEEIEIISKEIEKQHNAINVACEMLESGVYTKELFTKRTSIIEGKLKELNAQLTELENLEIKEDERANKALPILSKVIDKYDTLDAKEKNNLLKKIIKSIDYTRLEDDFILNVELLI